MQRPHLLRREDSACRSHCNCVSPTVNGSREATTIHSSFPLSMLNVPQDLLVLLDSRSSAARKLCLSVLAVVLEHGGDCCRGPSLASLLKCARSDGDATVRCVAFSCAAEYLGKYTWFQLFLLCQLELVLSPQYFRQTIACMCNTLST